MAIEAPQQDTYKLPESNLAEIPKKDQGVCQSVQQMIASRTAQLIAIMTLNKINPAKKSLYKKMLERQLNTEEAKSLIKIVGRFLKNDTQVPYQYPENEEGFLDYGLYFLELLGDREGIIPCLEILLQIMNQTDGAGIFEDTLSQYGVYTIYMGGKNMLVYTDENGVQKVYLGNGRLYEMIDYGEENNIIQIGDNIHIRTSGQILEDVQIISNSQGEFHLLHYDKILGKAIAYKYSPTEKKFNAVQDSKGNPIFINGYHPLAGFATSLEKVQYH